MLKRVFFAIAGIESNRTPTELSEYGIRETIRIGMDVRNIYRSSVIFTDGEPTAIQSSHLMAGVMGVQKIFHKPELTQHLGDMKGNCGKLRESFRTPEGALAFLRSRTHRIDEEDETILFMTNCCWGLSFGGTWPRSSVKLFDLEQQEFVLSIYHGDRI